MSISRLCASAATLAAVVAVSSGCGDGSAGGGTNAADVDKFIGSWIYTSGQLTLGCGLGMANPPAVMLAGQGLDLTRGTKSDLIRIQLGCATNVDVKGNVASVQAGQTCTLSVPFNNMVIMGALTQTSWKMTSTGTMATTNGTGTVTAMYMGIPITCSLTEGGVMVKAGGDGGAGTDAGGGG